MRKLFALFIALAALTVLVSAIAVFSLRWTIQTKDVLVERYAQVEVAIEKIQTLSERRARKLRAFMFTGDPRFADERAEAAAAFDRALHEVEARLEDPQERQLLDRVEIENARVLPLVEKLVRMKQANATTQQLQRTFIDELQPRRDELDEAIRTLVDTVSRRSLEQTREANRRVANASALLGSTIALAVLSAMVLGLSLYRATRALAAEQEALARAARYQQEVMGIVGHDLRSPLAAILATASLPNRTSLPPDEQRRMERILRSARRIDALAAVLLDFTRLQVAPRVPIVLQDADFHELVGEHVQQMSNGHPIDLERSGDGRAEFDAERLGQAIEVILEQALAHAEPGSRVLVRSRGEGPSLALEVAVTGTADAGALLHQLFEPFAQGDGAEGPVRLSRGVGLYLARELVTAHNGTIDVRANEAGTGLFFRVHLPKSPRPAAHGPTVGEAGAQV